MTRQNKSELLNAVLQGVTEFFGYAVSARQSLRAA
jgi:hypothetical protein